jgi:hypothetical protein
MRSSLHGRYGRRNTKIPRFARDDRLYFYLREFEAVGLVE